MAQCFDKIQFDRRDGSAAVYDFNGRAFAVNDAEFEVIKDRIIKASRPMPDLLIVIDNDVLYVQSETVGFVLNETLALAHWITTYLNERNPLVLGQPSIDPAS